MLARERTNLTQGAVLRWMLEENVLPAFTSRALPFDLETACVLAGLQVPEHASAEDALIAPVARTVGIGLDTQTSGTSSCWDGVCGCLGVRWVSAPPGRPSCRGTRRTTQNQTPCRTHSFAHLRQDGSRWLTVFI